ncbi:helix-turn-helix domain-containing protein [Pseudodesulfovibrio indicus]|uniref:helix-turn-helix domain-containing protein n=1 Tax=Pseudodesulfovibrio indicus TaxID=1716143 RepID=UPI002930F389|nr:helix-turn-helix domain-containing protein [Pseudodesulfovibrio indicus]
MAKYWTVKMMADEFNLHPDTIYRMCERQEIAHHRIRGQIRFSPDHVKALKKATRVPARKGGIDGHA